jgi:hypothetical protein
MGDDEGEDAGGGGTSVAHCPGMRSFASIRLRTTTLLGILFLFAFGLGCSSSSAGNESCGTNNLPACPAGAACGGPCDPNASVTSCGTLACSAFCKQYGAFDDAGVYDASVGWEWECTLP